MKNEVFESVAGGVTAPQGYRAGGVHADVKGIHLPKRDLGIIYSDYPSVGAAVFTVNQVKAAPVKVSQEKLKKGKVFRGIVANSGNANACTGDLGLKNAQAMSEFAAKVLGAKPEEIFVCSTGRIGVQLPMDRVKRGIQDASKQLNERGSIEVAEAIMTTDTFPKECAVKLKIGKEEVRIGGIAKGAGMIDPTMATMLCFITTDAVISKPHLQKAVAAAVEPSFNSITIDGDMSTNDTVIALANGQARNKPLKPGTPDFARFQAALTHVSLTLAKLILKDGEGISRIVTVTVKGARNDKEAKIAADSVAKSTLVKTSWCGGDPNWGRILDSIGYSQAKVVEEKVDVFYDGVPSMKNGAPASTPFSKLKEIVAQKEFTITIDLKLGKGTATIYTTDLTEKYVELNKGE